jgi:hypothetical protein
LSLVMIIMSATPACCWRPGRSPIYKRLYLKTVFKAAGASL